MAVTLPPSGFVFDTNNDSGGAFVAGDPWVVGDTVRVFAEDVANTANGVAFATGLVKGLAATTAETWDDGDILYWDSSNEWLTTTAAGNTVCGFAAGDKAVQAAATADVFLGYAATGTPGNGTVSTAKIADNAVTLAKLFDIVRGSIIVGGAADAPSALAAKTDKQILVGDGTDLASVAVSGDATLANTGALTITRKIDNTITDPGSGVAIPVTASGVCPITHAGTETNTLAIPGWIGQMITLVDDVATSGERTITVATAFNEAAQTTIVLDSAGECITLIGVQIAGGNVWRVLQNDGATLS